MKPPLLISLVFLLVATAGCSPEVDSYMCQTDDCRAITLSYLSSAEHSVYFMAYSLTDSDIASSLVQAKEKGLDIKGVMEKQQNSQYSQFNILKQAGIDVAWDSNNALMHHKVFIIDRNIVLTGSVNPTGNGYLSNDENLIIIRDSKTASKFLKEFGRVSSD